MSFVWNLPAKSNCPHLKEVQ